MYLHVALCIGKQRGELLRERNGLQQRPLLPGGHAELGYGGFNLHGGVHSAESLGRDGRVQMSSDGAIPGFGRHVEVLRDERLLLVERRVQLLREQREAEQSVKQQ